MTRLPLRLAQALALSAGLLAWPAAAQVGFGAAPLPPQAVVRALMREGYLEIGRPRFTGAEYVIHGVDPRGLRVRVVVDAFDGALVSRTVLDAPRPREMPERFERWGDPRFEGPRGDPRFEDRRGFEDRRAGRLLPPSDIPDGRFDRGPVFEDEWDEPMEVTPLPAPGFGRGPDRAGRIEPGFEPPVRGEPPARGEPPVRAEPPARAEPPRSAARPEGQPRPAAPAARAATPDAPPAQSRPAEPVPAPPAATPREAAPATEPARPTRQAAPAAPAKPPAPAAAPPAPKPAAESPPPAETKAAESAPAPRQESSPPRQVRVIEGVTPVLPKPDEPTQ